MNGGFGLVLTGTKDAEAKARNMLFWDVNNGISRRAWGRNANANLAIKRAMEAEPLLKFTIPVDAFDDLLDELF